MVTVTAYYTVLCCCKFLMSSVLEALLHSKIGLETYSDSTVLQKWYTFLSEKQRLCWEIFRDYLFREATHMYENLPSSVSANNF